MKLGLLIFHIPGATWRLFKKCFLFFEHEGVFCDLKDPKIMDHNKKIFNLSYWTGLYDKNCRIYTPFSKFGYTGRMVTRHTGGLSQFPVVQMSWEKKSKKKPRVLTNFRLQDDTFCFVFLLFHCLICFMLWHVKCLFLRSGKL